MMEFAYFDTSALVKRYVAEVGSPWVNSLLTFSRHWFRIVNVA